MLKYISLITLSAVLAAPAIAQSSFNQSDLVCYMQTADGRTINLGSLCGSRQPSRRPVVTPAAAPTLSPYSNLGGLEINGRGADAQPCFGLDDRGNRCPTSR